MTPNYIAGKIEEYYQKLDVSSVEMLDSKERKNFNRGISLLERSLKINAINIYEGKIEINELTYKWAKELCERLNKFYNWYRSYGFMFYSPYVGIEIYANKNSFISELTCLLKKKINKSKLEPYTYFIPSYY
jgi:hypothetical protein